MPPGYTIAIESAGLVTSVGLSVPAACSAIRAKLTNPVETKFIDSSGEWIMAHEVPLERPLRGMAKLAWMAADAIAECLAELPRDRWSSIPLLLCVAERERPGRIDGLDDQLLRDIEKLLNVTFSAGSAVIAHGHVSTAIALAQARKLIHARRFGRVLIAATDSQLRWPTLSHYERNDRLLTTSNSNGFMPGEGAGALLVRAPKGGAELLCAGIGFGVERATVISDEPLRADGLTMAIQESLRDAGCDEGALQFKIVDLSGEQYYFKEASLAFSRLDRTKRVEFDIWHPAECVGEIGTAIGSLMVAVLRTAFEGGYAKGDCVLAHLGNDNGSRASVIFLWHRIGV